MMDVPQWITASGAMGALGLALATYLNNRPKMKLAELQGEAALWQEMRQNKADADREIAQLKADAKAEREECHGKIERLEARIADLDHDLRNETTSLDSFLLLAEANPEQMIAQIPRIREERLRHKERMALKRGAREGAKIANAAKDEK